MDQLDAFQYFLTNLLLHNVVLVVMAVLLGMVLGRLMFGSRKAALEQLQASCKAQQDRARAAEQELERLEAQHEELLARVEAGDTSISPEQEDELQALRTRKSELQERAQGMAEDLARGELEAARAENQRLSEELGVVLRQVSELQAEAAKARPGKGLPAHRGSRADVATLEQRIAEANKEREQVEKASAVLRKEMRGLRNRVKEIEQQESRERKLEEVLRETEERLSRSQAAEAKEARVRASLEKIVEELEWQLADAAAGGERSGDAGDGGSTRKMDDLTRIKGIGAVLQKKLRATGVTRLRQIADWTDEELAEFSRALRLRNRAERDDWRGQARALCDRD